MNPLFMWIRRAAHTSLVRNITSLYLVQIANYIIPLFTLPFLARVLGVGGMGTLATLQLLSVFGVVITEYGFQYSATRKVALLREDTSALAKLYSSVTAARLLLAITATVVLAVSSLAFEYIPRDFLVYFTLLGILVATALTPLWMLQGLERMEFIAIANLIARSLVTVLVFVLVRPDSPHAAVTAFLVQAVGQVISAVLTLTAVGRIARLSFALPGPRQIVEELRDGWTLFRTTFLSYAISNVALFALGLTTNREVVGGYAAADRVAKAMLGVFGPVSQAIYPRMSTSFARNYETGWRFFKVWAMRTIFLAAVLTMLLSVSAKSSLRIVFGEPYEAFAPILVALLLWSLLNLMTTFVGVQYLNNIGEAVAYGKRFTTYLLIVTVGMVLAVPVFGGIGAAYTMVLAETVLLIMLGVLLRTDHVWRRRKTVPADTVS